MYFLDKSYWTTDHDCIVPVQFSRAALDMIRINIHVQCLHIVHIFFKAGVLLKYCIQT